MTPLTFTRVSFLSLGQGLASHGSVMFGAGADQGVAPGLSFAHGPEGKARLVRAPRETAHEIRGGRPS